MVFGVNPLSDVILSALGLSHGDIPRFRDCFVANGQIVVYTRMGGGNRGHWDSYEGDEKTTECTCPGCRAERLRQHSLCQGYVDDDFDSTYATFYFEIPEKYKEVLSQMDGGEFSPDQRWLDTLAALQNSM
jgi:hypothetical protein